MDIKAPFTKEQVKALNEYQLFELSHGFTCGKCGSLLEATEEGWICPEKDCDYTQDWAHGFMTDPLPNKPIIR